MSTVLNRERMKWVCTLALPLGSNACGTVHHTRVWSIRYQMYSLHHTTQCTNRDGLEQNTDFVPLYFDQASVSCSTSSSFLRHHVVE